MDKKLRIIVSGGGTGGHIYPAVAVSEALQRRLGERVEILFVGAEGKMEMEKVPALGYSIKGLPVAGLQRRMTAKNLLVPFKVVGSVMKAKKIIKDFRADIVVGFGGYASAPVLWAAQSLHVPTVIQEQNSYAGVTNKILSKRAKRICVAYEGTEKFFPKDKIVMTGNPLRGSFAQCGSDGSTVVDMKAEGAKYFGLNADKPIVLIVGGSLGTRTLNNVMKENIDKIVAEGKFQIIWQNGKFYDKEMSDFMAARKSGGVWRGAFIDRMDLAYAAADVVVSRAGAGTVSELSLVGKPAIFVPSPNVAEDHQTKNAMALVNHDAVLMITDAAARTDLIPAIEALIKDKEKQEKLSANILAMGIEDSADRIVDEILKVAGYAV